MKDDPSPKDTAWGSLEQPIQKKEFKAKEHKSPSRLSSGDHSPKQRKC